MAKIKKKTLMMYFYVGIAIAVLLAVYLIFFSKPSYPTINTPPAVWGDATSKVEVVEFSDFQCPACRRFFPTIKSIKEEYKDKISFKYYNFPLVTIHEYAMGAALAAECANDQSKFWEYHDVLFTSPKDLTKSTLKELAAGIGLDTAKFNACLDSEAKKNEVEADINEGVNKGIEGTPTVFINGVKLEDRSYENFKKVIDEKLAGG